MKETIVSVGSAGADAGSIRYCCNRLLFVVKVTGGGRAVKMERSVREIGRGAHRA